VYSNRPLTCPCLTPEKPCPQLRAISVSATLTLSLAENVTFKYTAFFNLTKKSDGQTYLQPLDYKFVLDLKRGSCYFGNMFNGNKLLGEIDVLQFINTAVNSVYCGRN